MCLHNGANGLKFKVDAYVLSSSPDATAGEKSAIFDCILFSLSRLRFYVPLYTKVGHFKTFLPTNHLARLGGNWIQVRHWGLTYIHTCRYYFARHIATVCVARALADSPADFGLLGEQSLQKWEIPCLEHWWTAVQNLTPLALSSTEKSVIVQTNKQTNKQ